jgi:hypothetical protein
MYSLQLSQKTPSQSPRKPEDFEKACRSIGRAFRRHKDLRFRKPSSAKGPVCRIRSVTPAMRKLKRRIAWVLKKSLDPHTRARMNRTKGRVICRPR